MLWSMMRLIFKTSSVTPDFFYVFNLILSFSTCSESFEEICAWELLGANVLKLPNKMSRKSWYKYIKSNGGTTALCLTIPTYFKGPLLAFDHAFVTPFFSVVYKMGT